MCWFFCKRKELTVPEILHSKVKVGAYFDEANDVERWGMLKKKKLHGYGMRAFNKADGLEFGIFEDDKIKVRMWDVIHDIQEKIGTNSKMIATLVFGSTGAYIGEVLSPAAYHDNDESLRKDRYGIMIFPHGMYVGKFPPGYFMQRCEGDFYDLEGVKHSGIYDFNIEDTHKWGDDLLGQYSAGSW